MELRNEKVDDYDNVKILTLIQFPFVGAIC